MMNERVGGGDGGSIGGDGGSVRGDGGSIGGNGGGGVLGGREEGL